MFVPVLDIGIQDSPSGSVQAYSYNHMYSLEIHLALKFLSHLDPNPNVKIIDECTLLTYFIVLSPSIVT